MKIKMATTMHITKRHACEVSLLANLSSPLLAIVVTLVLSSMMLYLLDYPILPTFYSFFIEPLDTLYSFTEVVGRASILIIIAMGLSVGFRANIFNIGAEGQYIFGAIMGSVVAIYFEGRTGLHIIPLMILGAMLGGMAYASIPALLKNKLGTNEIITSLMLVYIAELLLSYLIQGPLKDPNGMNFPQSIYFSDSAIYPYLLEGTRLSMTPIIVLVLTPLVYFFLFKTYTGFGLKVLGFSQNASKYAGFSNKRIVWISFLFAGALSGLAGISETSANVGQLVPAVASGYGFSAIIVAFLGRLHPVGIVFAGLLLALIYIGAESAQISLGLPVSIGGIFQGLILFSLLACDFFVFYQIKLSRKRH